jgi:hypothetical protein
VRSNLVSGLRDQTSWPVTTVAPWLTRDPALAGAEVRDSGRGLHVLIRFEEPVTFKSAADRDRWSGICEAVQAVLPIDPDQPGLTAVTRPLGSINGKTGRKVTCLKPAEPVPVDAVLRLYERVAREPFGTVAEILLGSRRVTPCPICKAAGTSLSALQRVGKCYGACGSVKLEGLYNAFLAPRPKKLPGATDGTR